MATIFNTNVYDSHASPPGGDIASIYTQASIDDQLEVGTVEYDKAGLVVKTHMINKLPLANANYDWRLTSNANQRKIFQKMVGYDPQNDARGTTNKESVPEPPMRDINPVIAQKRTRDRQRKNAAYHRSTHNMTKETMNGVMDQRSLFKNGHDMRPFDQRLPVGSNLVPNCTRRSLIERERVPDAKTAQHALELPSAMGVVTAKVRRTKLPERETTRSSLPSQEEAETVHLGEWNQRHLTSMRGNDASESITRVQVQVEATTSRDQQLDKLMHKSYDILFLPTMDASGAEPIAGGAFDVRNAHHTLIDCRRDDLPTSYPANRKESLVQDGLQLHVGDGRHPPNRTEYSEAHFVKRKQSELEMKNINGNIYDHVPTKIMTETETDPNRIHNVLVFDTPTGVGDLGARDRLPHADGPACIGQLSKWKNERIFGYDAPIVKHGVNIMHATNLGVQTKKAKPRLGANLTLRPHSTTHYIVGPDDRDTSSF